MFNILDLKAERVLIKLDPDRPVTNGLRELIKSLPIRMLVIGGTQNVTIGNSYRLFELIKSLGYQGIVLQELSSPEAIILEADGYFLPVVLNTNSLYWLRDAHLSAIREYGKYIPWDRILIEGYLVCNPLSAISKVTGTNFPTASEAVSYLKLAEKIYNMPVFYLEYSGRYGDKKMVEAVLKARDNIHLIYGGGITTIGQAKEMLGIVDTIVIGNLAHEAPRELEKILNHLDL